MVVKIVWVYAYILKYVWNAVCQRFLTIRRISGPEMLWICEKTVPLHTS